MMRTSVNVTTNVDGLGRRFEGSTKVAMMALASHASSCETDIMKLINMTCLDNNDRRPRAVTNETRN